MLSGGRTRQDEEGSVSQLEGGSAAEGHETRLRRRPQAPPPAPPSAFAPPPSSSLSSTDRRMELRRALSSLEVTAAAPSASTGGWTNASRLQHQPQEGVEAAQREHALDLPPTQPLPSYSRPQRATHKKVSQSTRGFSSVRLDEYSSTSQATTSTSSGFTPPPLRYSTSTLVSPRWRPDKEVKECQSCGVKFGVRKRKHHCRVCGDIFCEECSCYSLPLGGQRKSTQAVRACRVCYNIAMGSDQPLEVGQQRKKAVMPSSDNLTTDDESNNNGVTTTTANSNNYSASASETSHVDSPRTAKLKEMAAQRKRLKHVPPPEEALKTKEVPQEIPEWALRRMKELEAKAQEEAEKKKGDSEQMKKRSARRQVAAEILNTERTYVANMRCVVENLVNPLKYGEGRGILTEEQIEGVFLNIEQLLEHHTGFLSLLEQRITNWTDQSTVADIFLDYSDFLMDYEGYLKDFPSSQVMTLFLTGNNAAFRETKQQFEAGQLVASGLPLEAFLIQPVQRLPRYLLLLKEMCRYSEDEQDLKETKNAHKKLKGMLAELNSGIDKDGSNIKKLLSVEESLSDYLPCSLYHPQRRFIREATMGWQLHLPEIDDLQKDENPIGSIVIDGFRSAQKHTFFLFDDLLVCCSGIPIDTFENQQAEREKRLQQQKLANEREKEKEKAEKNAEKPNSNSGKEMLEVTAQKNAATTATTATTTTSSSDINAGTSASSEANDSTSDTSEGGGGSSAEQTVVSSTMGSGDETMSSNRKRPAAGKVPRLGDSSADLHDLVVPFAVVLPLPEVLAVNDGTGKIQSLQQQQQQGASSASTATPSSLPSYASSSSLNPSETSIEQQSYEQVESSVATSLISPRLRRDSLTSASSSATRPLSVLLREGLSIDVDVDDRRRSVMISSSPDTLHHQFSSVSVNNQNHNHNEYQHSPSNLSHSTSGPLPSSPEATTSPLSASSSGPLPPTSSLATATVTAKEGDLSSSNSPPSSSVPRAVPQSVSRTASADNFASSSSASFSPNPGIPAKGAASVVSSGFTLTFHLQTKDACWNLIAPSPEEKEAWLQDLNRLLQRQQQEKEPLLD
ncbi:Rabenosyn-5 [Balamuthia mandrillaris]